MFYTSKIKSVRMAINKLCGTYMCKLRTILLLAVEPVYNLFTIICIILTIIYR
ncbi:MAG: hypothetical protein JWR05_2811 [Mucilaginibacter sp.]|jgi:hypothetical protein|nr:hypothetical protein [Mucilaginibacter sp.]